MKTFFLQFTVCTGGQPVRGKTSAGFRELRHWFGLRKGTKKNKTTLVHALVLPLRSPCVDGTWNILTERKSRPSGWCSQTRSINCLYFPVPSTDLYCTCTRPTTNHLAFYTLLLDAFCVDVFRLLPGRQITPATLKKKKKLCAVFYTHNTMSPLLQL